MNKINIIMQSSQMIHGTEIWSPDQGNATESRTKTFTKVWSVEMVEHTNYILEFFSS